MPTLSPAPSLTPSPVSTTSDNSNHRPFAGGLLSKLGNFIGRRFRKTHAEGSDIGTLTGASLGLLALLLAFSFSIAVSHYDTRRNVALEEANAIGSTANFALMLPNASQETVLSLLRDYTIV